MGRKSYSTKLPEYYFPDPRQCHLNYKNLLGKIQVCLDQYYKLVEYWRREEEVIEAEVAEAEAVLCPGYVWAPSCNLYLIVIA